MLIALTEGFGGTAPASGATAPASGRPAPAPAEALNARATPDQLPSTLKPAAMLSLLGVSLD
jgi:hypothetical protein